MASQYPLTAASRISEFGYRLFHACADESGADLRLNIYLSMVHFARLMVEPADIPAFEDECVKVARRLGLLHTDPPAVRTAFVPSRHRSAGMVERHAHASPPGLAEAEATGSLTLLPL